MDKIIQIAMDEDGVMGLSESGKVYILKGNQWEYFCKSPELRSTDN